MTKDGNIVNSLHWILSFCCTFFLQSFHPHWLHEHQVQGFYNTIIKRDEYEVSKQTSADVVKAHLRNSCCKCCPAAHGCSFWYHCGRHTWSPTLCFKRVKERGLESVRQIHKHSQKQVETKSSVRQWKHHRVWHVDNAAKSVGELLFSYLRLTLCNWDPAGSSSLVTSPPPAVRNLSTTAVMSPAQLSLSSREQASKKWSAPFFVWSLNTNYE